MKSCKKGTLTVNPAELCPLFNAEVEASNHCKDRASPNYGENLAKMYPGFAI